MDAIEDLSELSEAMLQASALLADEDVDEPSTKRNNTFLNVVVLGNVVSCLLFFFFYQSNFSLSGRRERNMSFLEKSS